MLNMLDEAPDIGWLELGQFPIKKPKTLKTFLLKNKHWIIRVAATIIVVIEFLTAKK